MPEQMLAYGKDAAVRGLEVIIAGAGGAAHLPGMLASVTPLPVIGVPVPLARLDGMDSLLSFVQMPAGLRRMMNSRLRLSRVSEAMENGRSPPSGPPSYGGQRKNIHAPAST